MPAAGPEAQEREVDPSQGEVAAEAEALFGGGPGRQDARRNRANIDGSFSLLPEPAGEISECDERRRFCGFPQLRHSVTRANGTSGVAHRLCQMPNSLFNPWPMLTCRRSPYDEHAGVGLHLPDLSTAGALLAEIVLARPVDFTAGFTGSTGYARIAATGETALDVQKNGSNVGTVTFAAASSTPVFALASPTSFAAGDRLGIVNEDPADATLAGVSLTFAGTRGS